MLKARARLVWLTELSRSESGQDNNKSEGRKQSSLFSKLLCKLTNRVKCEANEMFYIQADCFSATGARLVCKSEACCRNDLPLVVG